MSGTKPTRNSIGRTVLICLAVLLQVAWLVVQFILLREKYAVISTVTGVLSLLIALQIFGSQKNASFKITWFFLIFLMPIVGILVYALSGYSAGLRIIRRRFDGACAHRLTAMPSGEAAGEALRAENLRVARQSEYIHRFGTYPPYKGGRLKYFADALDALDAQKQALRGAESFIFMEYFAIQDSRAFSDIKQILAEKAAQGVEVRLLFDDAGSLGYVNRAFVKQMQALGVQCRVFNPIVPVLNIFMNHRDHRKVCVVDGRTGFTGGYNLADEYFNYINPYGHWKDTGVMLEGAAVQSLTAMFLEMWDAMTGTLSDYAPYLPPCPEDDQGEGYIQPYADSPLDDERVGENVYLNMIKSAVRYVHIVTPYLILDDELSSELTLAAKRGVEVCIMTPGIPDKKLIFQLTRSYYAQLVQGGVRIYEYTPGFPHAKMLVYDDEAATVGTVNMDYRSLYLHFEDGVFIYGSPAVKEIDEDILRCLVVSRDVTEDYAKRPATLRLWQSLLRLIAPLT